ncbi:hypothetical protein BST61_g6468 [Cercospora zeina]
MSATTGKNKLSSSPEQAGIPIKNNANDQRKSESVQTDDDQLEDFKVHVRPLTGIAKFMAEHSHDEDDPMTMGQIGLVEPDWQEDNEEWDEAMRNWPSAVAYDGINTSPPQQAVAPQSSPTPVDLADEQDDFEVIDSKDIPEPNEPAHLHEQHVLAMAHHVVPPYPIPARYAALVGLEDISREDRNHRYQRFTHECYPGDDEQREEAMKKANQCAPRFGHSKSSRTHHSRQRQDPRGAEERQDLLRQDLPDAQEDVSRRSCWRHLAKFGPDVERNTRCILWCRELVVTQDRSFSRVDE